MKPEHPGSVHIPSLAWKIEESKEVLSVWRIPPSQQDGVEFPERFVLAGETEAVGYEQMGDLLAQIALRHIFFACKGDNNIYMKMVARVQKDFMSRMDFGKTRQ